LFWLKGFAMADAPANTRMLLVDDDEVLRETLCIIFEQEGFQVRTAANVNAALRLISSEPFDVLVSDLHMPHEGMG
jgi:DNA-binding NtrC family response regulator